MKRNSPPERQLRRRQPVPLRNLAVVPDGLPRERLVVTIHVPFKQVEARRRGGASGLDIFTRENATGQRGIGQQSDVAVVSGARLCQISFVRSSHEERIRVLDRDDFGPPALLGLEQEAGDAPARLVGDADMPHFPLADDGGQRLELLLERDVPLADVFRVVGTGAEQRDVAIGPVDLQEVDVVCAEPGEAALDGLFNLGLCDAGDLAS